MKNKDNNINKNIRIYKLISYIGFLWVFGLIVPEKNREDLKFHVGQGIILNILEIVLLVIISIANQVISASKYIGLKEELSRINYFGSIISIIGSVLFIVISSFYIVFGIINVVTNQEKKLPLIGHLAFYK